MPDCVRPILEADGPDVPAEGGITDLRIELKEDLILRIKWKNPSPSPNTETGLWIASSNSKGEVWSIPNECSNIADSEDENQVYFKNGALTCSDGSAHSALSLVLQSCTKYDVTLTLVDSTNTTILPVANGSFVNKQLLPTGKFRFGYYLQPAPLLFASISRTLRGTRHC